MKLAIYRRPWQLIVCMACTPPAALPPPPSGGPMSTVPAPAPSPTAAAYAESCQHDLETLRQQLAQLTASPAPRDLLADLNGFYLTLDRVQNLAGLYRNVHPDADIRDAASSCEQEVSRLVTELSLAQPLFKALQAVDLTGADAATQRLVQHQLRDLRRSGVDRDAATQQKIRDLRATLVTLGQRFDRTIREDVRHLDLPASALAGLPEDYRHHHGADAQGRVRISTEYPDAIPFMLYAEDDDARRQLYIAMRQRGYPDNQPVLQELLGQRHALAQLLGYANWAAYITEDKMIGSDTAAAQFIARVSDLAGPRAKRDYDELLAQLRRTQPQATAVGDWQKGHTEEALKRQRYQLDGQKLRSFFPFARVKAGLFDITGSMFGVHYRRLKDVPVWHESVEVYEIADAAGPIGRFYLDLHPRPHKYNHAAAFALKSGIGGTQLPESVLVCNFPPGDEALMEHDEVRTFFHEFGHLLHHLFAGRGRWLPQSGISTEWDFVEAPSQMLEEWTYDRDTLRRFAHNAAGQPIDDALVQSLRRARDFGKGIAARHQMFYAAVSLELHRADPTHLDMLGTLRALQAKHSMFAYVPNTHFHLSFGHLEGYSAIYYTYMWSQVIAQDMFQVFVREGLLNPATAQRYRSTVLAPGGSRDAAALVHDFLGRDFSLDAYAHWLNADH